MVVLGLGGGRGGRHRFNLQRFRGYLIIGMMQVTLDSTHVVPHSIEYLSDFSLTLNKRKDTDGNSSTKSPGDRDKDPECKVVLREHTSRHRKDGPNQNQNEGKQVAATNDPPLGSADFIFIKLCLCESTHVLLHKVDVIVKCGEVVVLRINARGVDVVDDTGAENSNQVARKHDLVCS